MDKSWMKLRDKFSEEYRSGVDEFIAFAHEHNGGNDMMLCPCTHCANISSQTPTLVRTHLILYGMRPSYTKWVFHGEQLNSDDEAQVDEMIDDDDGADEFGGIDTIQDLLGDLYRADEVIEQQVNQNGGGVNIGGSNEGTSRFDSLLKNAQRELYPGCKSHSVLSFVLKLVHLKDSNHWSNKSFEMLLKLLKEGLPTGDSLPATYYEAKKMLRDLGLGYENIHACFNDCVLFWKELKDKDHCPVCKESRWKDSKGKSTRIPRKVLRYFPLIPRLQRLFTNKEIASDLRYHSEKRVPEENVLRHPADGEAWKHLDRTYTWLPEDPRHLRLGLATDGFNPFGLMSSSHSVWPVLIVVYNLPPWRCMKEPFILMPLLIPGKKSPGKDIDVYLRPLVEELKVLFSAGAVTYDAVAGETFNLRGVLLWTINDLPALGSVFGYVAQGYKACPVCLDDTYSQPLRSKIGFLGHRRFLPIHHRWRKSKAFNGKNEKGLPSKQLSGNEIFTLLQKLDHLQGFVYGKKGDKKRKAPEKNVPYRNFTKKSILFELPYWKELLLRHNLDVMHIEKNIGESLLAILLNIIGKTKDTLKARMDLKDMNIRHDLHLQHKGNSVVKPPACYTLSKDERKEFLQFIESIRFPDGFAANISRGVNYQEGKVTGLKSHDYHILIQRILALGIRGFLHKDICDAMLQLGSFFRQLCAKTLRLDVLAKLEQQIIVVLCKLEMIFPPAFFDLMVHLTIHLPHQARLGGPVHFRWMFFVERFLGTLKGMVSNKAHPEGSIAKSFSMKECSTYCSMYLNEIETRFNREERNNDGDRQPLDCFSVFSTRFRAFGHKDDIIATEELYNSLSWYVLNNCEELQQYLQEHEDALVVEGVGNVPHRHQKEFATWLRRQVIELRNQGSSLVSDCLHALAIGPHKKVHRYSGCIVGGVRFLTKAREEGRQTQNSGVCVEGPHKGQMITYYGVLTDVYVLDYPNQRHVALFKCDWFDLDKNKAERIDNDFISVNVGKKWYVDDSFVLAGQVGQVFYVNDTKLKGDWRVVQKVQHRHLFDPEIWNPDSAERDLEIAGSEDVAFQDEEAGNVSVDETFVASMLHREDVSPELVNDPKELASLIEKPISLDVYEAEADL